jgi:hypothetical protein
MTIIIDTLLDNDVRIVIEFNNIYILYYINLRYPNDLNFNSNNYNIIHDEYMKIFNNFPLLRHLNQSEFLNWVSIN